MRQPARLAAALLRAPVVDRHQAHQLQFQPIGPTAPQAVEHLQAEVAPLPPTIDMAANRPQTLAPGPQQGPLGPLLQILGGAAAGFGLVGDHCRFNCAGAIGETGCAEGLVQVGVGFHQWGEGQRQLGRGGPLGVAPRARGVWGLGRRMQRQDAPRCDLQYNRHQTVGIPLGQSPIPGIQKHAGDAQWRQQVHGSSPCRRPVRSTTKRPAAAKVVAL